MDKEGFVTFWLGFGIASLLFSIGILVSTSESDADLIKHGCKHYNTQTGNLEWGAP